ncbi:MAG TPA: DUF6118 family protein [Rhizomicrobium sp.]|jgi:hypothetical protein
MAELPNLTEPEPSADPAALAFEALREEVALMRRALAGLAAERASIEIPDYSETLAQIQQASVFSARKLKAIAELPILQATASDWARTIEQTGGPARREDREALAKIYAQLQAVARDMGATLRSVRTAGVQRQWLLCTFSGGVLAGMLLWAFALGPAMRAIL